MYWHSKLSQRIKYFALFLVIVLLVACQKSSGPSSKEEGVISIPPSPTAAPTRLGTQSVEVATQTPVPIATSTHGGALYLDPSQPVEARVEDLLARMTLDEKIGQMTQVENNSIAPYDVKKYYIGSVLSGGGSWGDNSARTWAALADGFQEYALQTELGIPIIFGVDSVHGYAHVYGAVIFPHNIGLGATREADLVERIGRATAEEMGATGIRWNFAPTVAVVQDVRWGRTYEGYSENTQLVTELAAAYVHGMQYIDGVMDLTNPLAVLATPKHFLGDGGTTWQSSKTGNYLLDQGDTRVDEATLRELYLPPYQAAIEEGALSIMPSFSSWNGTKMHANPYLLTDVLKGELGFKGFLISDWQAIDQISSDYYQAVVTSINAGLDMNMVPYDYISFINTLKKAVTNGDVPMERIDDAVRRILTVKFMMGLFENPFSDPSLLSIIGSEEHRALGREAVRKSLVLLKNENETLPISKDAPLIFVAGKAATDIGLQCGGWTIEWQGKTGAIEPGTTILEGIQQAVSPNTKVVYDRHGIFDEYEDEQGKLILADVGIVVVAEKPYAEGVGDSADPKLTALDVALIEKTRQHSQKLVVIVMSGRPIVLTEQYPLLDALVAAWLPGTEAGGVADVLFGDYPFTGKLPYTWQRSNSQLPFDFENLATSGCDAPLFPFGYGLGDAGSTPIVWEVCP